MPVRHSAVDMIASCLFEDRSEAEGILDEWAEAKCLDFSTYVPAKELDSILEILSANTFLA